MTLEDNYVEMSDKADEIDNSNQERLCSIKRDEQGYYISADDREFGS